MTSRLAKRLLIVGWDAADWVIIDQLFARGEMPHLKRLVDAGVRADLATLEPRLSPLLWTSIATGKTADRHGVLNFVEPDPVGGGVRISTSTSRKTKALWNILTQSGLRTNVVSWYASHPAEPIHGICVSNLFQEGMSPVATSHWPVLAGSVHPASFVDACGKARMHPSKLDEATMTRLVPRWKSIHRDDRIGTLSRLVAQCLSVHQVAMSALEAEPLWDCTMVFHDTIDTVGHHFMQFHPPRMPHVKQKDFELLSQVMRGVYCLHDHLLGRMLQRVGPDTTVLLLSDHGFHSDHLRPVTANLDAQRRAEVEASWHRPLGVLVAAGPGIRRGTEAHHPTILDIAPTALRLLGLAVGDDMNGRTLGEIIDSSEPEDRISSWDDVAGEAGLHPADIRQDPFNAHDALQQLIDLGYMAALPEDAKTKVELTRLESNFNLAVVYSSTNRPALALPLFEELVAAHPSEPRYVLGLAQSQFACGRFAETATLLQQFLRSHETNVDARLFLAGALAAGGNDAEAKQQLGFVIGHKTDRPDLAVGLGDVCSTLGDWLEAELHYRSAVQHNPGNSQAHVGLARSALGRGQYERAAEHSLDALERDQRIAEGHFILGIALAWLGDEVNAIQSLSHALRIQPGMIDAHAFVGELLQRQGKGEQASSHIAERDRLAGRQCSPSQTRTETWHLSNWIERRGGLSSAL